MFLKDKKIIKKNNNKSKNKESRNKSTQEWLPVSDVVNGTIYRKDGIKVAALQIEPINIDLFSEKEKIRIISALHEIINGLKCNVQILAIGRPVDLDGYLKGLDEKIKNTDNYIKKKLLQGYAKQAAAMAASGETLERKFYFISSGNDENELKNKLMEISSLFKTSELNAKMCQDLELVNLQFLFTHPAQAAFERIKSTGPYLPPVYERRGLGE
ncbi:MAG: hypothetical protein N2448_06430 [Caloramator sp.]|nr:hypothetical protein [Caloramator sp.]